ncbi:MAG TPA: hypothetical protein VMT19_05820 [Thermoanaerobaculaceae bacterium]|nr:hypothetical protein [Thermoanaerobaculaceae bacterium]
MIRRRLQATLPAAAFAALAAVMAGAGGVPPLESFLSALSVALAFVPSGWHAPGGWWRRVAEATVVPTALALVFVADPTLRRMMLPPLLVAAALAAAAAALRAADRRGRAVVLVALALAVRAAGGLGLAGYPAWRVAAVLAAVTVVTWLAARATSTGLPLLVALAVGAAPLERVSLLGATLVALAAAAVAVVSSHAAWSTRLASGWGVGAAAATTIAAALAPWGGPGRLQAPSAPGWVAAATGAAALAATPVMPPALAGAAWLGAASLLGRPQPPPPDRPGVELTAAAPETPLPPSEGGPYVVELSLANSSAVPQGTTVASLRDAGPDVPIRAGVETAEWAHERDDVRPVAAHALPTDPVWRPAGFGRGSTWAVAGRLVLQLPKGVRPRLVRSERLPPGVTVGVAAAGTSRPTPPRDWPATSWILAAAVVVAALQVAGKSWRAPSAAIPWALLTVLALATRLPVAPLGLAAERHAVDLALAALVAAWLPVARAWLSRGRTFAAAAALLVPLALATPHLTPPLYGDEPFHLIVLDSLAHDHDLDLSNNYDLEHHPYNRIYITGSVFLHSPVLAVLLLPGYLIGGRSGALALLALGGAGLASLVVRRARELGVGARRRSALAFGLLLTYPLATFSTQIWVEVVGGLAAAACLVLLARPSAQRVLVTTVAAVAVAVKTRLGLLVGPLALAAWWPRRRRPREFALGAVGLGLAMAAALAVEALFLGHPLGMRRLPDIVPRGVRQPALVAAGLAFDPAGGLAFAAPLLLLAVAGIPALWRRGGWGERGLALGCACTVAALLNSLEWYGGGAPPARYLVPFLPLLAVAAAMCFDSPPLRALAALAVPTSLLTWWVFVTRPHLTVNPGDGGWWLADALARRFGADARHLVPSFLRPSPATVVVPIAIVAAVAAVAVIGHLSIATVRAVARAWVSVALVTAAAFIVVLTQRHDRVVELEDPQVAHLGGTIEPKAGTYSRFRVPNGWRVRNGEGVDVPLNLAPHSVLRLELWLEGAAQRGVDVAVRWDGSPAVPVAVAGAVPTSLALPPPPSGGRHRLGLVLAAPAGGEAVLDRIVVTP